jgi:hypothetical protein
MDERGPYIKEKIIIFQEIIKIKMRKIKQLITNIKVKYFINENSS